MPSNVYLFDPNTDSRNSDDKPLIQVMREAELARSVESARIIRNAAKRVARLFQAKKPIEVATPRNVKTVAVEKPRLAA